MFCSCNICSHDIRHLFRVTVYPRRSTKAPKHFISSVFSLTQLVSPSVALTAKLVLVLYLEFFFLFLVFDILAQFPRQ